MVDFCQPVLLGGGCWLEAVSGVTWKGEFTCSLDPPFSLCFLAATGGGAVFHSTRLLPWGESTTDWIL